MMSGPLHILLTGSAGFIGHHVALGLVEQGVRLTGLDTINDYYDPDLKFRRLAEQGFSKLQIRYNHLIYSNKIEGLSFIQLDLTHADALEALFARQKFDIVINLAAQAGVRHSIDHPLSYVASNLLGFTNLLECCRKYPIRHLLFASSSSVYGNSTAMPLGSSSSTDKPVSFYAATKKANELMAHSYAHLFRIPTTGLRFFTVYGPWGRPDMAYFRFARAIQEGSKIQLFNFGQMQRDFTYIADVVACLKKLLYFPPRQSAGSPYPDAPFRLFNIGNSKPEPLMKLLVFLEKLLGKTAVLELLPMQDGDVYTTYADNSELQAAIGYQPTTPLKEGLKKFVDWFRTYYPLLQEVNHTTAYKKE